MRRLGPSGFNPNVPLYKVVIFRDGAWQSYYTSINKADAIGMAYVYKSEHPDMQVMVVDNMNNCYTIKSPVQIIAELVESADFKCMNIERIIKEKAQYSALARTQIKPQLETILMEIAHIMKKVSDIVESDKGLMQAQIQRKNKTMTLVLLWMMEIKSWYIRYELKIKNF